MKRMSVLMYGVILLLIVETNMVNSLSCRTCTGTYYRGEPYRHEPCYDDMSPVPTTSCPANTVYHSWYCRTEFTIQEGTSVRVSRGCVTTSHDYDDTVTGVPTAAKCVQTTSGSRKQVKCYYPCETDNCNSHLTMNLKQCSSNCSQDLLQGYCDYLTGKCVCNDGFTGSNCSMQAQVAPMVRGSKLRCIQCSGEIDSNCGGTSGSLSVGSECLNSYDHCFVSKTITLNSNGTFLSTVVVRGCTPYYSSGYCTVQGSADDLIYGHKAYSCVDVCSSDNCNSHIPAVTEMEAASRLRCVQCKDPNGKGSCINTRETACPVGSNYCYSDVEYFAEWGDQGQVTSYSLVKLERGCSGHEKKPTVCTNTSVVGTNLRKVSCFENCQTNGCNDRWPNKPKCIQCTGSFSVTFSNAESCFHTQTLVPQVCSSPTEICSTNIYTTEVAGAPENFYVKVFRACSSAPQNTTKTVVTGPVTTKHYFRTCSADRCNSVENDYRIISNYSASYKNHTDILTTTTTTTSAATPSSSTSSRSTTVVQSSSTTNVDSMLTTTPNTALSPTTSAAGSLSTTKTGVGSGTATDAMNSTTKITTNPAMSSLTTSTSIGVNTATAGSGTATNAMNSTTKITSNPSMSSLTTSTSIGITKTKSGEVSNGTTSPTHPLTGWVKTTPTTPTVEFLSSNPTFTGSVNGTAFAQVTLNATGQPGARSTSGCECFNVATFPAYSFWMFVLYFSCVM